MAVWPCGERLDELPGGSAGWAPLGFDVCDQRVVEHRPFFVLRLWRR